MVEKADALLSEQNTESFVGKTYEHKDYALHPGKETTVMLFLSLPNEISGISELDQEEKSIGCTSMSLHHSTKSTTRKVIASGSQSLFAMLRCSTRCGLKKKLHCNWPVVKQQLS